ncbi:MAG TPA: prepilin-type N-terminal cleavage/methylation domain-containing protein [Gammaproteobacteria bacterium]
MKHPAGMRQRGVTLIELVLVIVIVAIAAVAIMDPFVTSANSYRTNESVQTAAQLAQECAEHILATRRLQDFTTANATDCPALPAAYTTAGYARTRSFGAAPSPCFTSPCTQVDVVVTHSGSERARVVFMLGSY